MLLKLVFTATALAYTSAAFMYGAFLMRGSEPAKGWGERALWLAVLLHAVLFGIELSGLEELPAGGVHQAMAVTAMATCVAFLALSRRRDIGVLGAFLTPVVLLLFLGAGVGRDVPPVPSPVRNYLLPFHIGVNVLGLVAFAVAFAASVGYVMQERQLRMKRLGGIFQRLPPLDDLDTLAFRAVLTGFPLLTTGIVTGALFASRVGSLDGASSVAAVLSAVSWLLFAGVLLLRVAAGWTGRRAAIGTILGFLSAATVLLGYLLRGTVLS